MVTSAMTDRLYYEDAYRTEFEARAIQEREHEGRPAVDLDRTCFYPESGGQPCDTGALNGIPVFKVIEEGETIWHVLGESPAPSVKTGDAVVGRIDWPRRFDHMQQHTGQHILSQAFVEVLRGETRSFHLGADVSTLEIGLAGISDDDLDKVESRANQVVSEDLEVKTYFVPGEKIGQVPLRRPPKKEGLIRVVEVQGFDYSACGGTHCRRSGEVGLIKVTRWDKIRGNLRFEFLCGRRAMTDYGRKSAALRRLSGLFSVSEKDLYETVEKSLVELKAQKKTLRSAQERAARFEALELFRNAGDRVLSAVFADRAADEVRLLALSVIRQTSAVVLFGVRGAAQGHIILARSEDIPLDLRELIPLVLARVDGKGGGSPSLVEIVASDPAGLEQALDAAADQAKQTLDRTDKASR